MIQSISSIFCVQWEQFQIDSTLYWKMRSLWYIKLSNIKINYFIHFSWKRHIPCAHKILIIYCYSNILIISLLLYNWFSPRHGIMMELFYIHIQKIIKLIMDLFQEKNKCIRNSMNRSFFKIFFHSCENSSFFFGPEPTIFNGTLLDA